MAAIDAKLIFAVLGPLFFIIGVLRCVVARALVPQAKAWMLIGVMFSGVAWWLWR